MWFIIWVSFDVVLNILKMTINDKLCEIPNPYMISSCSKITKMNINKPKKN